MLTKDIKPGDLWISHNVVIGRVREVHPSTAAGFTDLVVDRFESHRPDRFGRGTDRDQEDFVSPLKGAFDPARLEARLKRLLDSAARTAPAADAAPDRHEMTWLKIRAAIRLAAILRFGPVVS